MTTNEYEAPTVPPAEDEEPTEAQAANVDVSAILADPSRITLSNGEEYIVERLRTRGLLRLMKIFTAGAADVLTNVNFSLDMDPQEFAGIFIGSVLFSVPEQEDESLDFLQKMVRPARFISNPKTPQEREANANEMAKLQSLLDDPELDDTFTILESIITIEAPNILSLGKRLSALLAVQRKSRIARGEQKRPENSSSRSGAN